MDGVGLGKFGGDCGDGGDCGNGSYGGEGDGDFDGDSGQRNREMILRINRRPHFILGSLAIALFMILLGLDNLLEFSSRWCRNVYAVDVDVAVDMVVDVVVDVDVVRRTTMNMLVLMMRKTTLSHSSENDQNIDWIFLQPPSAQIPPPHPRAWLWFHLWPWCLHGHLSLFEVLNRTYFLQQYISTI